jgi:hypothetical protein
MSPERRGFVITFRCQRARVGAMGGVDWRMYLVAGIIVLAVGALVLLGFLPSGLAD